MITYILFYCVVVVSCETLQTLKIIDGKQIRGEYTHCESNKSCPEETFTYLEDCTQRQHDILWNNSRSGTMRYVLRACEEEIE